MGKKSLPWKNKLLSSKRKRRPSKKLTNKPWMTYKPKKTRSTPCPSKRTSLNNKLMTWTPTWNKKRSCEWTWNEPRGSWKVTSDCLKKPSWIWKMTSNDWKKKSRRTNSNTTNWPLDWKTNNLWLLNSKRRSRNCKPESKNWKKNSNPNELPELRLKNNEPKSPENWKNCPNDSKKLVVPPLLKSN